MGIFDYITIERRASHQVIELLEQNRIGTPGESMVYKLTDVSSKIEAVPDPTFASLYIRSRLYGTICFSKRIVYSQEKKYPAYYLRYFTFREKMRSAAFGKHGRSSNNKIVEEVHRIMQGEGLEGSEDAILYAYVDPENVRSKRLIEEFGFRKVGDFHTLPFSRISPKVDQAVEQIKEGQLEEIREMLLPFYQRDQLVFFEYLHSHGNYFVIRENNEIVCGVQAIQDGWEILDMPGLKGMIMMHLVPRLPFIGKLFNPNYRFVFFEHIYCQPGKEALLERLFESVLAHYKLHSAVICMDPRSAVYGALQQIPLGLTHKLMGEKEIEIYLKSNDSVQVDSTKPFFISGFDVL